MYNSQREQGSEVFEKKSPPRGRYMYGNFLEQQKMNTEGV